MKKIAVFCALPPNHNTGMATVDLAAFSIVKRLAPQAEIILYSYGKASKYSYNNGDLPYEYIDVLDNTERYLSSDIFLFWGDFTHTRSYWKTERAMQHDKFFDYSKYIFLTLLPASRLKDVVIFGSTIITNDAADQTDTPYYENFKRFFKGASAVYFRDALSAAKISHLRNDEATLGCDCAFLLEDHDLSQIKGFKPAEHRNGIGVFFGRTPSKIKMMVFAKMIGKFTSQKCTWLPWLEYHSQARVHRWPLALMGFWVRSGSTDPGVLLSALSGYKYIVTDTYHVCVNAWRMGIPAICIGQGSGQSFDSLGDKKKEILYEMYCARPFYVFIERLRSPNKLRAEAKLAASILTNRELLAQVNANVSSHRATSLQRLNGAMQKLLA